MILTKNEKKILRFLAASIGKNWSINEVGKACGVTSGGALKILIKLENEGVVKAERIANLKAYRLDFQSESTESVLHLAFIPGKLDGRIKLRADDLKPLKECTKLYAIFGSYVTNKPNPSDIDILFVIEKKDFQTYKRALEKVKDVIPVKVQDVIQTSEDLKNNLKNRDPVIMEVIQKGIFLWGSDALMKVIRNVSK